ncbi:hypothetical protein PWT90_05862 [Aphanocladium album]|nr:hypothetical protein PWT90_05862 [Aphanocladium album]
MRISSALGAFIVASTVSCLTNAPDHASRYIFAAPYDQSFLDGYSVIKHVGSIGPYSNHVSYGVGRDPPDGCVVDQVIMLRRHGERYPQSSDMEAIHAVLRKLYSFNITAWEGDLRFLNHWQWLARDSIFALETASGPYSGLLTAYKHGTEYRARYGHLFNPNSERKVPMWTAQYERVIQTARKFGEGFFGWNYTTSAALNLIPEGHPQGANSLTPKCPADKHYTKQCQTIPEYRPEFDVAAARFNGQNPGLKLNASDIYQLMYLSVYELTSQGYSDWTNVFTLDEWVNFGYTEDLSFYYCVGPGNKKYSSARGSVFANASVTLLNEGPEKNGALFFNFAHDSNITPVLFALGIHVPDQDLPISHIPFPNPYKISDIMPMSGSIVLERLQCNATTYSPKGTYVRVVLNEAVIPYNSCQDGPGFSCSLGNFTEQVGNRLTDYVKDCKVDPSAPQHLSFWWEYDTSNANNFRTTEIPYQGIL